MTLSQLQATPQLDIPEPILISPAGEGAGLLMDSLRLLFDISHSFIITGLRIVHGRL